MLRQHNVTKVKVVRDQLALIGYKLIPIQLLMIVLSALPKSFRFLVTSITTSFEELGAMLVQKKGKQRCVVEHSNSSSRKFESS